MPPAAFLHARMVVALALAALVSAAASAREGGAQAADHSGFVLAVAAPVIALMALVAVAGAFVAGYSSLFGLRWDRLVVIGALAAFLTVPFVVLDHSSRPSRARPVVCSPPESSRCKHAQTSGGSTRLHGAPASIGSETRLIVATGSVALIVVVGLVALLLLRRRSSTSLGTADPGGPLVAAVDESLDDLRLEQDVRRAVIACYARMERALLGVGFGRGPAEAPLEYLRRVLASVAPAPGRRLTELFELAAFSVEPMGEHEKARAIAALEALRESAPA